MPTLRNIILLSEPEAAVWSILKTLRVQDEVYDRALMSGDSCFVLCDAGGGTVDLISYKVKQSSPQITLEEVVVGTGARCGATFIDKDFLAWLRGKLGHHFQDLVENSTVNAIGSHTVIGPRMRRVLRKWETIKRSFGGTNDLRESWISLPQPLNQLPDNPSIGICNARIRVTE